MDKQNSTFDLSVVIVNYNVTYFLEQCLNAVLAASIFHYGEYTVGQAKEYMASQGIPIRI